MSEDWIDEALLRGDGSRPGWADRVVELAERGTNEGPAGAPDQSEPSTSG